MFENILSDLQNGASMAKIYKEYGGRSIYIPKIHPDYKMLIRQEFNNHNHHTLAHKYNITVSQVYAVVKRETKSLFS